MISEIQETILNEVLEQNNKKIKEKESLEEYLKSFTNDELTRLAITHVWVDEKITHLLKIKNLAQKPKKDIIKYIRENLEDILRVYIKIINDRNYEFLKTIVNKNGKVEYSIDTFDLNLHFVSFLKDFCLAKVEYNKKEKKLKIYIPKEFNDILKVAYKDKNIISYNKRFNEICDYVYGTVEGYGVILLTKLHELFEKHMYKIDIHELNKIIGSRVMIDQLFDTHQYPNDILVCSIEFTDEDEALSFYETCEGEYYNFTKKDIELLKESKYITKLKSYKEFISYLKSNFEGLKGDLFHINNLLIMDYIETAQFDEDEARESANLTISELFEVNSAQKNRMINMIDNIYKEYPKWTKRGNK